MRHEQSTKRSLRAKTDYTQLGTLLTSPAASSDLVSLQALAIEASEPLGPLEVFELCSDPFCDGIGFSLYDMNFEAVRRRPEDLIATLRRRVKTLTFSWATFSRHGSESFVWLTP